MPGSSELPVTVITILTFGKLKLELSANAMIQDFVVYLIVQLNKWLRCDLYFLTFPNKLQFGIIDFA